jgi:hypothetical protein
MNNLPKIKEGEEQRKKSTSDAASMSPEKKSK